MVYPKNFEEKTGFDKIREMLGNKCLSTLGKFYVNRIRFSSDFKTLNKLLDQTFEMKTILLMEQHFPQQNYIDLTNEFERIKTPGTYLEPELMPDLRDSVITIMDILDFFQTRNENYPALSALIENIEINPLLAKEIDRIIDEKGEIRDSASPELKQIRKEKTAKESVVRSQLSKALSEAKKQGFVDHDIEATVRDGRTVIPVPATHKRKLKGYIHDESASGQTVFIEPAEVLETNNQIRELELAERREIIKILIKFTDFLREYIDDIFAAYRFLGLIDFIMAKAKLAIEINGIKPLLNDKTIIDWRDATHPLLYLSLLKQSRKIVPLTIELNPENRILVISGPNAGGKSVCLKTVGLLQYMLQCGLLVPMKETSETGIFQKLFIDIGDEQSIEDDLSTYSSHLVNMNSFIRSVNYRSLFLIDEFGSGTEPQAGGAIAQTVLDELNRKKSFGVVTTHYANLKKQASEREGIINGAMQYDTKALKPLYRLSIGKPGSSFAFEIASNIGLDKKLLNKAVNLTGKSQLNFERQIQELENEKKELGKKETELKVTDNFLKEVLEKYNRLSKDLEKNKRQHLEKAKKEAAEILDKANRLIENTIREIKESKAEKKETKKARKEFEKEKEKILGAEINEEKPIQKKQKVKPIPKKEIVKIIDEPIETGNFVRIIGQQTIGEVMEIKKDQAMVSFGSMNLKTPLSKLEKVNKETSKRIHEKKKDYSGIVSRLNDKLATFKTQIDLRGKRVDEALAETQQYIDDAVLLDVPEVRILHGTGTGVLRQVIREYLASIDEVQSYRDEHVERGGQGITIVQFKR